MTIHITAVICTHNRAAFLASAIESLLTQSLPSTDYEVLVIDSASTDQTPNTILRYLNGPGGVTLRSARQPFPSLSQARNLAVRMAVGQLIAFLDDDAVADPNWLAALLEAYDVHPDAWAVGGKVLPIWEGERPAWLTDDLLPQLSMLDLGDVMRPIKPSEELFGVNFSCRRPAFDKIGLFRADLGRQSTTLLGSEETEFQQRILLHGKEIIYAPHALVKHRINVERLRQRYFIRLAYGKGRTSARLAMTGALPGNHVTSHIVRGGLGVARRWLMLGLYPFDERSRLQCMRITARWVGFSLEALTHKIGYSARQKIPSTLQH